MVLRQLAGLPSQVRQGPAKVNGVLACSAGDFQHALPVGKDILQDFEYGALILLAGLGVRFHVFMVIDVGQEWLEFYMRISVGKMNHGK